MRAAALVVAAAVFAVAAAFRVAGWLAASGPVKLRECLVLAGMLAVVLAVRAAAAWAKRTVNDAARRALTGPHPACDAVRDAAASLESRRAAQ